MLVTDALPEVPRGGLDLHVRELEAELAARGHDVTVRAFAARGEADAVGTGGPPGARFRRSFANPVACARFAALVRERPPDVVHFHSLRGLHYAMPGIARAAGARVVWTQHDLFALCQRVHLKTGLGGDCEGPRGGAACGPCHGGIARLLGGALFSLRTSAMRRALRACDAIVAPSAWVGEVLFEHDVPAERVHVLPPAVRRPQRLATRPVRGRPRLVFAGDLRPDKGADLAVAAAAALETEVELDVHGGSPAPPASPDKVYEAQLKSAAGASPIRFHGRYEADRLVPLLDGAFAVIVPSRVRETFGRTANAALLAGVPVVAADHGGLAEQVTEGVNGALFPPGDARGLEDAVRRLLDAAAGGGGGLAEGRESWPASPDLASHVDHLGRLYAAD